MQTRCLLFVAVALLPLASGAAAQSVVSDLDGLSPSVLTKDELQALMTGANMSRVITSGSTHHWRNEPGGTFIISSDNRATSSWATTAQGTWRISDDGRYCLRIEWRSGLEDRCHFVIRTSGGYFLTQSPNTPAARVYRYRIGGK